MANTSITPAHIPTMTIPQINLYADKAGMFKIGPMGMVGKNGKGGKGGKGGTKATGPSPSVQSIGAGWVAAFNGIG